MTTRLGSLPTITVKEDYNANSVALLRDNFGYSKAPHRILSPRREGTITLPARYEVRLAQHKQKASRTRSQPQIVPHTQSEVTLDSSGPSAPSLPESKSLSCLPGAKPISPNREVGSANTEPISDKMSDRLKDLDTALKWIKQEVIQIKEEDRFLMRRLLDLRARLHQLQGLPSHFSLSSNLALLGSYGSDLDVATWSSFLSLDEDALGRDPDIQSSMKDLLKNIQDEPKDHNHLSVSLTGLSRSASSREPLRPPPTKIRRKKSLPMANELEEDHFFDDD